MIQNTEDKAQDSVAITFFPEAEKIINTGNGTYHIFVAPNNYRFLIRKPHYKSIVKDLAIKSDTIIHIQLEQFIELHEVEIAVSKQQNKLAQNADGSFNLNKAAILSTPAFLGENDPLRSIQMLPGVQSGGEGNRGLFVRGGSPDQNYMLIDGAPIYNTSHLYGFLSVYNSDAINQFTIYKDRIPSEYGDRLCSVVDARTEEGNSNKIKGGLTIGLIATHFKVEGPLSKNKKTTFFFSSRICPIGLLSKFITQKQFEKTGADGGFSYYFGDINTKIVHRFSSKLNLTVNFFMNRDYYTYEKSSPYFVEDINEKNSIFQKLQWSNYAASVQLDYAMSINWSLKQYFSFSRYDINATNKIGYAQTRTSTNELLNSSNYHLRSFSSTNQFDTRTTFHRIFGKNTADFGVGFNAYFYQTGIGKIIYENLHDPSFSADLLGKSYTPIEGFAFMDLHLEPLRKLSITGGFHFRHYLISGNNFAYFLPRLGVVYNPVKKFYLRGSLAGMSQNSHLLVTETSNILNDYWVPATNKAKPEVSWNFSAGTMQQLPLNFEWSVDGFYRIFKNIIEYKTGIASTLVSQAWENQIATNGKGKSYGLEINLARTKGKITGSASYTLAWSKRQFDSINRGLPYNFKYDRRHNIALQLSASIGKHIELGASWVYGSGTLVTLPSQAYQSYGAVINLAQLIIDKAGNPLHTTEYILVYPSKNNYRLPAYHHLDVSFTYKKVTPKFEHRFNISIYNVYNQFNIFMIYPFYSNQPDGSVKISYKKVSLLPTLPSLSYTINFL